MEWTELKMALKVTPTGQQTSNQCRYCAPVRNRGPTRIGAWMRTAYFVTGLLLLALATSLEVARELLSPRISETIHSAVLRKVVWQPDSPPDVQGELIWRCMVASFPL